MYRFFSLVLAFSFMISGTLSAENVLKNFGSREAQGRSFNTEDLLNEDYIIKFLLSQEVTEHFQEGYTKFLECTNQAITEYEGIKKRFPKSAKVSSVVDTQCEKLSKKLANFAHSEQVVPFLTFGVRPVLYSIPAKSEKRLRRMQVILFKEWLNRYQIGPGTPNFQENLSWNAKECRVKVLLNELVPSLEKVKSDTQLRTFVKQYSLDDTDQYDVTYVQDDPLTRAIKKGGSFLGRLAGLQSKKEKPVDAFELDEIEKTLLKAVESKLKLKYESIMQYYYSRDAVIARFLKENEL